MTKKKLKDEFSHGRHENVIVYPWRGKVVVRSMPRKSMKPPTQGQLIYRAKFTVVAQFLAPLRKLISEMYTTVANDGRARLSLASSYHVNAAVTGAYPNFVIDYSKVIISRGELQQPISWAAVRNGGVALITWQNAAANIGSDDEAVVVLYDEATQSFEIINGEATRACGTISIILPDRWASGAIHGWLSFRSTGCSSTSCYLGNFI